MLTLECSTVNRLNHIQLKRSPSSHVYQGQRGGSTRDSFPRPQISGLRMTNFVPTDVEKIYSENTILCIIRESPQTFPSCDQAF